MLTSKIEASYMHSVTTKEYGEGFLSIMDKVCFQQETRMDIDERISWL